MKYHYRRNIYEDILTYIKENYNYERLMDKIDTMHDEFDIDFAEHLHDELWLEDSVTGNLSGSYTMNKWMAEEFLAHNYDILYDAMVEFGCKTDLLNDPEACDVTIRCYLLLECIRQVLFDLNAGVIEGWA